MVEETKEQPRLQHLKQIEVAMQERCANEKLYEMEPLEGYENMSFEEKNATKYLATFPYPYMNGYLHLGMLNTLNNFVILSCLIFDYLHFRSRILHVQI